MGYKLPDKNLTKLPYVLYIYCALCKESGSAGKQPASGLWCAEE